MVNIWTTQKDLTLAFSKVKDLTLILEEVKGNKETPPLDDWT